MLTSFGRTMITLRGVRPPRCSWTRAEASATFSISSSVTAASTSIRSRTFPFTCTIIVTVSALAAAVPAPAPGRHPRCPGAHPPAPAEEPGGAVDTLVGPVGVIARRAHEQLEQPQGVGAVALEELGRRDDVALGLAHLRAAEA